MHDNTHNGDIILYSTNEGDVHVDVRLEEETVWLSQKQMARLFNKNVRTVNEHIQNVFKEEELEENSVIRNFRITATDGKNYNTKFYNLDVIISVGYRVKSQEGTRFRIWATQTLRDHILKGFTVNKSVLQQKGLQELQESLRLVQQTMNQQALSEGEAKGLLEVITQYTDTWLLLQQYDDSQLHEPGTVHTPTFVFEYSAATTAITELKADLMEKEEASELFGLEREDGLDSVLGGLNQTFDNKQVYPSVESKAANLLYLIIKNHPFSDGNKRIGSFLFVVFLKRNNLLFGETGERKFNNNALVALALLVAQSDPQEKEQMVRLIMHFISTE